MFLDNVIRHRGVEALVDSIEGLGKSFSFFYEVRAQIHPYELIQRYVIAYQPTTISRFGICMNNTVHCIPV